MPYDLGRWNYESSVSGGFERADAHSPGDTGHKKVRLAGLFAQCLHVGGSTPGREAAETYIQAANGCLRCSEDDAVQYDLVVAIALMEWGSLSQAEAHQIIQAKEC